MMRRSSLCCTRQISILPIRDAFYAACFNILRGISMMVDMPLLPGVLHGAGNSMAINHIPLGTPTRGAAAAHAARLGLADAADT